MKYAICILAHKKPELLKKLVGSIRAGNTEILIHLDAKCDIRQYEPIDGATFITNRVKVYWGGRSMVIAMYNLIEHVIGKTGCEYLLFISGEDYPLAKPEDYDKFIDTGKNYIEYEAVPNKKWFSDGLARVLYYYPFRSSKTIGSRVAVKLQKVLKLKKNLQALGFRIYRGSQWININRHTAEFILKNWSPYYRFFKFCHVPDEMLFQSLILNSDLKQTVCNSNLRYLRYDNDEPNAAYLNSNDLENIRSSGFLFCRKIMDVKTFDEFNRILERK